MLSSHYTQKTHQKSITKNIQFKTITLSEIVTMNLFVRGYTIAVTVSVLVAMFGVILSAENHIRSYREFICCES